MTAEHDQKLNQSSQDQIDYRLTHSVPRPRKTIPRTDRLNPSYEADQERMLNKWWEQKVEESFRMKFQVWQNDRAAVAATRAGLRVENYSHEFEEDDAANSLEKILSESNGFHFEAENVLDRARQSARELGAELGKPGAVRGFLSEFVDILGKSRELSETKILQLKTGLLRSKYQLQRS